VETVKRAFNLWVPVLAIAAIMGLAVAVFVAVFFRGREVDLSQELGDSRELIQSQTLELTRLREAFAILNASDTVEAVAPRTAQVNAKLFVNSSLGILLMASHVPPSSSGRTYEMWLVTDSGMQAPAGLFQAAADGTALHVWRGAANTANLKAVRVTIENASGASQPTSAPEIDIALPHQR
jgi:hypothetical protein